MNEREQLVENIAKSSKILGGIVEAVAGGNYENAPELVRVLQAQMLESEDPMVKIEAASQLLNLGLQAAYNILDLADVRDEIKKSCDSFRVRLN
jgi:hypothetical protein